MIKKQLHDTKLLHQNELKNIKAIAKQYTLDFFREKSRDTELQYNRESKNIYQNYDRIRSLYFAREKKMAIIIKILNKQEKVILDLKNFMTMSLDSIFRTLFDHEPQILEEIDALLPTNKRYSKYDRDNPFSLYCGYLDLVRPINCKSEVD